MLHETKRVTNTQTSQDHRITRSQDHNTTESRDHKITRSQDHRITRSQHHRITRSQDHKNTISQDHKVTRSQDHRITRPQDHKNTRSHDHKITGSQEHKITGSQDHKITISQDHNITRRSLVVVWLPDFMLLRLLLMYLWLVVCLLLCGSAVPATHLTCFAPSLSAICATICACADCTVLGVLLSQALRRDHGSTPGL